MTWSRAQAISARGARVAIRDCVSVETHANEITGRALYQHTGARARTHTHCVGFPPCVLHGLIGLHWFHIPKFTHIALIYCSLKNYCYIFATFVLTNHSQYELNLLYLVL